MESSGDKVFLVHCDEWFKDQDYVQYRTFMNSVDGHLTLKSDGCPEIQCTFLSSAYTDRDKWREIAFKVPRESCVKLVSGRSYNLHFANGTPERHWLVAPNVSLLCK